MRHQQFGCQATMTETATVQPCNNTIYIHSYLSPNTKKTAAIHRRVRRCYHQLEWCERVYSERVYSETLPRSLRSVLRTRSQLLYDNGRRPTASVADATNAILTRFESVSHVLCDSGTGHSEKGERKWFIAKWRLRVRGGDWGYGVIIGEFRRCRSASYISQK